MGGDIKFEGRGIYMSAVLGLDKRCVTTFSLLQTHEAFLRLSILNSFFLRLISAGKR